MSRKLFSMLSVVELIIVVVGYIEFFFFKQKTAYEMRISDWSSDVCSSDLHGDRDRCREPCSSIRGGSCCTCGSAEGNDYGERRHRAAGAYRCHQIGRASCRERVCQYV